MCDRMCVLKHLFSLSVAVYVSKILSVPVRGRPTCWRSNHKLKMLYIIYTLNLVTVFLLQDLCILSSDVWLYLFQWNMLLFVIANWMRLYICKWSTLFKEMQIIFFFFFFFVLLPFCLRWLLSQASLVKYNFWPVANVVPAPTSAHPFCSASPSPCPWAQKKVHCAGRERVKRGLVLVSAMCCIWNTHLPLGFASGAGFLFRLSWAGAGFGPALWLARVEALWTPGWLELPNSNPSITGIQIQTRA